MDVESVAVLLGRLGDLPGVGVDVEAVDRFTKPDRRLFTAEELAYCAIQANPAQSRAGRWCAKEAVSKACAKYLQLTLREIEIRAGPSGRPIVVFPDRANGVGLAAEVSIAHAGGTAIAVAVAVVTKCRVL
jgi:phosphopantetheine--protein transferase-like protein